MNRREDVLFKEEAMLSYSSSLLADEDSFLQRGKLATRKLKEGRPPTTGEKRLDKHFVMFMLLYCTVYVLRL